ncbi:hypothetical protein OKW21_000377 [Catalinimonas alkaloidigena]|uniref:hypothetical protein n=1 Tax=Catalinimonas alkaloidigena TaxID=1075417 RepID=UPI002406C362|nr:hypothetical protein [Catalinimonas alkaloidigena]MDF9795114.1 hypothetical protein [Catalinimonas alkaloidigena]
MKLLQRSVFISSLICFSSFCLLAQDAAISDYINVKNDEDLHIIGGNSNGFFVGLTEDYYYSGTGNKQVVSYYDIAGPNEVKSVVMKQEDRSRDYFYTFSYKDQLHTLSHDTKESDDGLFHIYLNSYNQQMESVGQEKDLDQIYPYIFTYDVSSAFRSFFSNQFGKMRKGLFITPKTNAAEDKLALFFDFNYFSSTVANFQCVVLNENLEEEWSNIIDLPTEGSNLLLEDYALANDGKLYILMASFEDDNFKKSANDFEYLLYSYDPESGEASSLDFDSQGKFVINMGLALNENQQPVLAGVYANPQNNDIEGGMMIKVNVEGSSQVEQFAFDKAVMKDINEKEDKEHAEEYTVNNMVLEDDGSLVFFAESYKRGPLLKPKLSLSAFNPVSADVEMGDIYKKILAVKIAPDQSSNWVKIIDKNQRSSESKDIYASYAFAYDDASYYLLFNNDIKNASDISLVTLQKEGDISLTTYMDRSDYRVRLIPAYANMLEPGLLTVPVEKSGKQGILRIKF